MLALLALLIGGALIAGCGSSSKPAYCNAVTKTENAVKSLPTGTREEERRRNAQVRCLHASAKRHDRREPSEDRLLDPDHRLKNSVDALANTVKQIASSPTVQTLAELPAELSAVGTAAKNLQSAAASKCG